MAKFTRREFLKVTKRILTITGLGVILAPIAAYFYPPNLEETPSEPISLGPMGDFPVGESKTIRYGRYPALIINTPEGLRAYSAICTHFACIVKWDRQTGKIICPCHDGLFDPLDGSVLSGPPPVPLTGLPLHIIDGQIFLGGEA